MRRPRWVAAAALLVVAALACGMWIYHRGQPQRPLPAANASVQQVAVAYLDAAVRQDCGFTRALTTEDNFAWCTSPAITSYRDLTGPTTVHDLPGGSPQRCMAAEVTITPTSDGTFTGGPGPWNICLVSTPGGWRVYDQGRP